jgi:hypothetical protein
MTSNGLWGAGRLLAIAAIAALLGGCTYISINSVIGSGPLQSEVREVADFSGIEIGGGIRLDLTVGGPQHVELAAQANLLPIISTTVSGGRLMVAANQSYTTTVGVKVTVTVPALSDVSLDGGAMGTVSGISADMLSVHTDGGAFLTLSGSADSLTLSAGGGSRIDAANLPVRTANVSLEGGVLATLTVSESATGSVQGGVVLTLRGQPATVSISQGGGALIVQQ